MARQRLDACGRFLLLLLHTEKIVMTMLTGCPNPLRHQLRLCESLLELLHAVINLHHPFAHTAEPGFLAGFLRYPLCKLRFAGARFLLKPLHLLRASQRITHFKRLKDVEDETKYLLDTVSALEDRLGVILFQLPPNMKKDLPRLEAFLQCLPATTKTAFEFRHQTWFEDDVLELLSTRNHALCISDTDDLPITHIDRTADWGYLRLRRVEYSASNLEEWLQRIRDQKWKEAFIFFKHEDEGTGPKLAGQFLKLAGA